MSINVGMVGTGFMAVAHLKAWAKVPGVRIAALCNPSGNVLAILLRPEQDPRGGGNPIFKSIREWIEATGLDEAQFLTLFDVERVEALPAVRYTEAIKTLEERRANA